MSEIIKEQQSKVCLTTFVYGVKYQSYIPFLLYSCNKAYPEYDIVLFLYEELDEKISAIIQDLNLTCNLKIVEKHFSDCKNMTPLKSKALRWVLWDENFTEYDYIYTVDIDMLYITEPVKLHHQHRIHLKNIDLPFSNLKREYKYKPLSYTGLGKRIANAGLQNIFGFLTKKPVETKLSGLHFVETAEYYKQLNHEKREKFRKDIYNNTFLNYVMFPNNEILLAYMMKFVGFDLSKVGMQTNSVDMLDYNGFNRAEFRPHHGLHMGVFRADETIQGSKAILDSEVYKYYIDYFRENIQGDLSFEKMVSNSPDFIRLCFDRMYKYYNL
ncbi:conserved hypothetical protein [Sphingobacterium sp. PM2-P1-29]|nr:conserved hypothetical protein [Sphingobacterium sp. PM2-P1-29]